MSFTQKLINYFSAGYPCIAIVTHEEKRAQGEILAAAKATNCEVMTWSAAEGLFTLSTKQYQEIEDLLGALREWVKMKRKDTVFVLRDVHMWNWDKDPVMARYMREVITEAPRNGNTVIFVAPEFKPFLSIEKLVTILEYSLPTLEDRKAIAAGIQRSVSKQIKDATLDVLKALAGMSTTEAENALSLSVVETGEFTPAVIYREKVLAVKRSKLLEIIDPDPNGLDAIGGLENLKEWIIKRKKAYSDEAQTYGLPAPKGVLLTGVPGSGKSLSAKAFGTALGIPTLRLDIGSMFNSLVGESEARMREALQLAEAMSPCLIWADEIDKSLSGSQGSGSNDSGVTRRVFGTLLTWMQEKKQSVMLVMTANQVEHLPPEFLRRGRFDEIFSIDLPHVVEREQITSVILKRFKRDPKKFDLAKIAEATNDCTGAEIEAVVSEALFHAFDAGREIETDDILAAAKNLIPLAKTAAEKIEAIRKWGDGRARQASKPPQVKEQQSGRKLKV